MSYNNTSARNARHLSNTPSAARMLYPRPSGFATVAEPGSPMPPVCKYSALEGWNGTLSPPSSIPPPPSVAPPFAPISLEAPFSVPGTSGQASAPGPPAAGSILSPPQYAGDNVPHTHSSVRQPLTRPATAFPPTPTPSRFYIPPSRTNVSGQVQSVVPPSLPSLVTQTHHGSPYNATETAYPTYSASTHDSMYEQPFHLNAACSSGQLPMMPLYGPSGHSLPTFPPSPVESYPSSFDGHYVDEIDETNFSPPYSNSGSSSTPSTSQSPALLSETSATPPLMPERPPLRVNFHFNEADDQMLELYFRKVPSPGDVELRTLAQALAVDVCWVKKWCVLLPPLARRLQTHLVRAGLGRGARRRPQSPCPCPGLRPSTRTTSRKSRSRCSRPRSSRVVGIRSPRTNAGASPSSSSPLRRLLRLGECAPHIFPETLDLIVVLGLGLTIAGRKRAVN